MSAEDWLETSTTPEPRRSSGEELKDVASAQGQHTNRKEAEFTGRHEILGVQCCLRAVQLQEVQTF